MLVVTVLAVWLIAGVLGLSLCASAARGDRALGRPGTTRPRPVRLRERLVRGVRPAA